MFRLKEVMQEKGISNIELAKRLNMTAVSISYMVTGKTEPNVSKIYELAKALGVEDWELFKKPKNDFEKQKNSFVCPHCGRDLKITIE